MMNSNDCMKDNLANGTSCYGMHVRLKQDCPLKPECWEGYMVNTMQTNHVAYIVCKREKKKDSDPDCYF